MNILIDDLPSEIAGVPIRTDYRYMLLFEELLHDTKVNSGVKVLQSIDLLYTAPVPDVQSAWDGLLWYYSGGHYHPEDRQGTGRTGSAQRQIYDFEQDAERIYAAFWQVYQIDLQVAPLHWWAFRSLLFSLPETCLMGEIMRIRATDISGLKGAERRRMRHLQEVYAIHHVGTQEILSVAERDQKMREYVLQRYQEAEAWKKNHR